VEIDDPKLQQALTLAFRPEETRILFATPEFQAIVAQAAPTSSGVRIVLDEAVGMLAVDTRLTTH
jgi:hypothetical protein